MDARRRLSAKNIKLLRPTLFNYIVTRDEFDEQVADLFNFITKDKIDVKVHKIYDLQDVATAHSVCDLIGTWQACQELTKFTGPRGSKDHWQATSQVIKPLAAYLSVVETSQTGII